jgi:hypothetical protein
MDGEEIGRVTKEEMRNGLHRWREWVSIKTKVFLLIEQIQISPKLDYPVGTKLIKILFLWRRNLHGT